MGEGAIYPRSTIDRLVDGLVWKGINDRKGQWMEAEPAWAEIRSNVERTGDIESEAWLEVMDLENAIASLRGEHPEAAAAVTLVLFGFGRDDVRFIRNFDVQIEKAKNYLSAYLSGEDPERAYRKYRPKRAS